MAQKVRDYYREMPEAESRALLHEKLDWLAQALHYTYRQIDDTVIAPKHGSVKKKLHIWPYPFPNLLPGDNIPNLGGNSDLDRDTFLVPGQDGPSGTDPQPA